MVEHRHKDVRVEHVITPKHAWIGIQGRSHTVRTLHSNVIHADES